MCKSLRRFSGKLPQQVVKNNNLKIHIILLLSSKHKMYSKSNNTRKILLSVEKLTFVSKKLGLLLCSILYLINII